MRNFDEILKAVRQGKEFYIDIAANNGKVQGGRADSFMRMAKARSRKQNPISPNQADYVNWILYDRISFAAAAVVPALVKLFIAPIGTNSKTKVDTNMTQVSVLEAPQWFNSTGLSIYFNPNVAPIDLDNFLSTEYLEYWVSQKVYVEGPLDCFPGSGGLYNQSSITTTAAAGNYLTNTTNGWPSIHNMYDLRLPAGLPLGKDSNGNNVVADGIIGVTILQSQTFNVQFKADAGGATMAAATGVTPIEGVGLTLNCRLSGILSRGVQ